MFKDNAFSVSRFMNLCRKNMVESWKTNLLRIVLMYGVMVVIFVCTAYAIYSAHHKPDELIVDISLSVFLRFGVFCGCISASLTMVNMRTKTSRISAFMIPATPFEKYFSRWLVSTIVYIVVFIIAFKLADYTRVIIYSIVYPDKTIVATQLKYLFATNGSNTFVGDTFGGISVFILLYFLFQSCFILGSSIWPKNSFIKTFLAGLVILLLHGLIIGGVSQVLIGSSEFNSKMFSENLLADLKTLGLIWGVVLILFNWTLAYFRFQESEIKK